MQRPSSTTIKAPVPGVFETIAGGLSLLLVHPALALIPLLLDGWLWMGAKLSPSALADPLVRWLRSVDGVNQNDVDDVAEAITGISDLTPIISVFVPSLLAGMDDRQIGGLWERSTLTPSPGWVVPPLVGLLILGGIALGIAFRLPLAHVIRGGSRQPAVLMRECLFAYASYAGFIAMVVAAIVAAVVPATIFTVVLLAAGINASSLLVVGLGGPLLAALVFLWFVPDAIVVGRIGPLRACSLSFGVVRRHFWSSVGFILVTFLTSSGAALALESTLESTFGAALAIVLHAILATTLAYAQMQFFYDRWRHWHGDLPTARH